MINGVVAVPVMALMMLMAKRREIMGGFTIKRHTAVLGWLGRDGGHGGHGRGDVRDVGKR